MLIVERSIATLAVLLGPALRHYICLSSSSSSWLWIWLSNCLLPLGSKNTRHVMSWRHRVHLSPLNGITFLFNGIFYAHVIFTPSTLVVNTGLYRMGIRDFDPENMKSNGVSAGEGVVRHPLYFVPLSSANKVCRSGHYWSICVGAVSLFFSKGLYQLFGL